MKSSSTSFSGTSTRISFPCGNISRAREILNHLTEERLIAGGTIIQAESVNWIGGDMERSINKNAIAYTTIEKLPLIRDRLEIMYGETAPEISQFVMQDEKKSVTGWIERNTRG